MEFLFPGLGVHSSRPYPEQASNRSAISNSRWFRFSYCANLISQLYVAGPKHFASSLAQDWRILFIFVIPKQDWDLDASPEWAPTKQRRPPKAVHTGFGFTIRTGKPDGDSWPK